MSGTPRTDAAAMEAVDGLGTCVGVNFARTLEREIAATRSETVTARVNHLATMRKLAKAKYALRLIRDIGGTNHPEFAGLQCDGMWCARQASRALESIEGDK